MATQTAVQHTGKWWRCMVRGGGAGLSAGVARSCVAAATTAAAAAVVRADTSEGMHRLRVDAEDRKEGQRRGKEEGEEEGEGVRVVQYTSVLGEALRRVKTLSLAGLCASTAAVPAVHLASTGDASILVPLTMLAFSGSTTALLNWFSSPYVLRVLYSERRDELELETLSFTLQTKRTFTKVDDIGPVPEGSLHPLGTFSVGKTSFYVDTDQRFVNTRLLTRILAQASARGEAAAGGRGDEDGALQVATTWDDDDDDDDDDDESERQGHHHRRPGRKAEN